MVQIIHGMAVWVVNINRPLYGGSYRMQQLMHLPSLIVTATYPDGLPLRLKQATQGDTFSIFLCGDIGQGVQAEDIAITVKPTFAPTFSYTPHLTPEDGCVVDMHVFHTPVLMLGDSSQVVCVMPALDHVQEGENRVYLDLDVPKGHMTVGMAATEVVGHVLYRKGAPMRLPAGNFSLTAQVMILTGAAVQNPYRAALAWWWQHDGQADAEKWLPRQADLSAYITHAYEWALHRWPEVWQAFEFHGKKVGAPQFIVTAFQSPNYAGTASLREEKAIWNQAWFSSMRSARGLYLYGKAMGNETYMEKALLMKQLALSMPQKGGLFCSVLATPMQKKTAPDGTVYQVSQGWDQAYAGNSNRNPQTRDLAKSPYHLLDMSWTAWQMLLFHRRAQADPALVAYAASYAERLLTLQDERGYFPAWLDLETEQPLPELRQSPESAVSASFLLELYSIKGDERYLHSALRCLQVLTAEVLPESRWEDFETYWSCSPFGQEMQGRKFPRNGCCKQCSLSPFWMAQAYLQAYQVTGERACLRHGERSLCEMLMYQTSFQPSYMPVPVIGGFGVMNGDGEHNDARASLFAETIWGYGQVLGDAAYISRAWAAAGAAFTMMYCPENPRMKALWEARWPFFNERDYGFTMENFGHSGRLTDGDMGMGAFAIFDWGCGSAAQNAVEMLLAEGLL